MKLDLTRNPVTGWPGAICVDAPTVALGWAWLLSHEQGRQLDSAIAFSLYVFVWLIYALDRFFQAFGIDAEEDTVRHRFWFNYKYYLSIPVAIATAICVYLVFWVLPWEFLVCSFVLVMALSVYLFFCCFTTRKSLNFTPKVWLCGLLFSLGVQLAAGYYTSPFLEMFGDFHAHGPTSLLEKFVFFFSVSIYSVYLLMMGNTILLGVGFALNCAAISLWQHERSPNLPDRRSFAALSSKSSASYIRFVLFWIVLLLFFATINLSKVPFGTSTVAPSQIYPYSLLTMVATLCLLLVFHAFRKRFSVETLRLIADSVFLTPFLWMIFG